MAERAQLDISEPYKVYRLVPPTEQGKRVQRHLLPSATNHQLPLLLLCLFDDFLVWLIELQQHQTETFLYLSLQLVIE